MHVFNKKNMYNLQNLILKSLLTIGNSKKLLEAVTNDLVTITTLKRPFIKWLKEEAINMPQIKDILRQLSGLPSSEIRYIPTKNPYLKYWYRRYVVFEHILTKYFGNEMTFALPDNIDADELYTDALKLWLSMDHIFDDNTVSFVPEDFYLDATLSELPRYFVPVDYRAIIEITAENDTQMIYPSEVFDFKTWSFFVDTALEEYISFEPRGSVATMDVSKSFLAKNATKSFYTLVWLKYFDTEIGQTETNSSLLYYDYTSGELTYIGVYNLSDGVGVWIHELKDKYKTPLLGYKCSTCFVPVSVPMTCSMCETGIYCTQKCFKSRNCLCS